MLKSLWRDVRASLNRIFAIVVKEFAVTFGDKGSRMVLIAPVFLQAILFGYGATFNLERVPWVLLDESHSSASAEIVRGITGNGIFDLKRNAVSLADFEKSIDSSEALVGVYFPNDFDRKGEMMVVSDARNSTTAGIAYGYISSIATQVNAKHGGGLAVEVRDRARWNENGITRYTIVPGLIPVLALIQVLLLAGLSVSREREDGSFDMMLMTPADSIEILIGKAVMPTLIACGQAFLIFAIGFLWFELPFKGSFLLLGLVIFGFSLCMVGLGLGVSAVADNIQQSIVMIIVMMLPMVILSGLMTSVRAMPHWMQTATILNPLRYSIQAIRAVYFEDAGLMDILPLVWPVALVGLGSMSLATYLFRHKIS